MRRSPKMDPPEGPEPVDCACGWDGTEADLEEETFEHDDGGVTMDLLCPECGTELIDGLLVREPEGWSEE